MTIPRDTPKRRPGLTTWIVVGLFLGLFCGLFFGEYTSSLKWIGDAFVGLLQMAVLPYVAVSLIANIGRLSPGDGWRLMRASILVMLVLWSIGVLALVIMTLSFPVWETGSFFSSRFTEEPPAHDWLDLFIPSNPFRALAENSIPAVVVFSIGIGIALMRLPGKEKLLDPLNVLVDALANLNKLVVRLTPVGMFAIVANTAGTIDFARFNLIQGYLITYAAAAILLSFVVLPIVLSALTPLTFRQVVQASRDPLVAAFVIGNSFVVLPMIIDAVRRLEQEGILAGDVDGHQAEYLVPLAYPFPDIGRIAGLIFIPFAAWFYGTVIDPESYPPLLGVGLLGSFGKPVITIPLLLSIAELPSDIFDLFLASGVVAARFGDLMKTMHLMAFTILTICVLNGTARVHLRKLLVGIGISLLLMCGAALLIRGYLNAEFKDRYSKEQLVTERDLSAFPNDRGLDAVRAVVRRPPYRSSPNLVPVVQGQLRVQRIRDSGQLRVGYYPNRLPFSYFNSKRKLIGFDIEMAYYLADDLGVDVVFVPVNDSGNESGNESNEQNADSNPAEDRDIHQKLDEDHFDVVMSAMEGTVEQAALLPAIQPYMDVTLAVVVPDHEKSNFRTREQILNRPNLKIAYVKNSFFSERARQVFREKPDVEYVELDSADEYFEGRHEEAHGLVISAESGSAWTMRYPGFTVANPVQGRIRVPLYYLTAADLEFETFLQNWITLKRSEGTYQQLYDYWILGLDDQTPAPRWCIIRDVLGWVE